MLNLIFRRFIRSKSPRLTFPRVRNPPSLYASQPNKLIDGSLFIRLNEFKKTSQDPKDLPPMIEAQTGHFLSEADITQAKELRKQNPKLWTVALLAKKFKASYKFIHDNVLNEQERKNAEQNEQDRFVNLSLHKLKGLMVREKIRLDRLKSF